jgi:hypothetical protein
MVCQDIHSMDVSAVSMYACRSDLCGSLKKMNVALGTQGEGTAAEADTDNREEKNGSDVIRHSSLPTPALSTFAIRSALLSLFYTSRLFFLHRRVVRKKHHLLKREGEG